MTACKFVITYKSHIHLVAVAWTFVTNKLLHKTTKHLEITLKNIQKNSKTKPGYFGNLGVSQGTELILYC